MVWRKVVLVSACSIAVIVHEGGKGADQRLARAVTQCQARGLVITGLVQHNDGECALPGFAMALEDIATGQRIGITEISVGASQGCRLDAGGLAQAAVMLNVERHRESQLVVINKFGRQEVLGQGLRAEMAALLTSGLPVLTTVRRDFLPAFETFAGADWAEITADAGEIVGWLAALSRTAQPATAE